MKYVIWSIGWLGITLGIYGSEAEAALSDFLYSFTRTTTLLEINPGSQSYSFSLAHQFPCTAVVLESQEHRTLLKQCISQQVPNLILLAAPCGGNDYQRLIECEHFDVVIVRHLPQLLKREPGIFSMLFYFGDYTCISLQEDASVASAARAYAETHECECQEWGGQWLLVHHVRPYLLRKAWDSPAETDKELYVIHSSFEKKEFVHKMRKTVPTSWIPGINLATYMRLKGIYPMRGWVREQVLSFKHAKHNDFWMGNIVMQGLHLQLIDCNDSRRNAKFKKHFNKVMEQFE